MCPPGRSVHQLRLRGRSSRPNPRAVVIPFGVPDDGRGLGLGLAALVHSFAQIDGESVALAQLLARRSAPREPRDEHDEVGEENDEEAAMEPLQIAMPVEAFIPPHAWKDLTGNVNLLVANLTTQVRAIAEVATAVTQGDLTRSITVDARGEVA